MKMLFSVLLAALTASFMLQPAAAQDNEANVADVWIVNIKKGMDDEFSDALKEHLQFRSKKGDTRSYQTYTPVVGDKLDHYVIRSCCSTYEEMDTYVEWSRKAKTGDHWNENVDQYVAGYRHYLQTVDMENSNWPEEGSDKMTLFGVTEYKHKMGRAAQIATGKALLSNTAKEGDWPYRWAWVRNSGGRGTLQLVVGYENYTAMKPPTENFFQFMTRMHGEEKAQSALADWSDNFHATSYTVYRHVPDLSMKRE